MRSDGAAGGWADEDVVLIARVKGHDLFNLIQAVDGWLQLGQVAEARRALADMSAGHVAEARALQSCPASLAAELVMASVRARADGIAWHFEPGRGARADLPEAFRSGLRAVLEACREAAAVADAPEVAVVAGAPGDGPGLDCELAGDVPAEQVARLASFGEGLRQSGLDVSCETIDDRQRRAGRGRPGRALRVSVRWRGDLA